MKPIKWWGLTAAGCGFLGVCYFLVTDPLGPGVLFCAMGGILILFAGVPTNGG